MNLIRKNVFTPLYKICNNGSNEEKYRLIKDGYLKVPRYIDIELTNHCNLRCRMCPTGTGSTGIPRGFMSEQLVDIICENITTRDIKGVRCIGWGEPTLHPDFWSIIKKLKNTGAIVHFNTNGVNLSDMDISQIVDLEIESIKFSFQGTDKKSYSAMRVGGSWDSLIDNIKKLNDKRKDKLYPFIQITTTITNETEDQVKGFEKTVRNICDYYNIGHTELSHLNPDNMDISEKDKEEMRKLKNTESIEKKHFYPCPDAFDHFQIMWNGDVTLCCNDYGDGMIIGNIHESDFETIFLGEKADAYRRKILEYGYDSLPMCSKCYEWAPLTR